MIIVYYLILAFGIALATMLLYYLPIVRFAKANGVDNSITQYPIIGAITYLVVTAVMAPFVVSTLILPSHGERFREGLFRAVCKPDE